MTAATTRLTVRVILNPAPVSQPAAASRYRWDRILLVTTAAIIAVGLGLAALLPKNAPPTPTITATEPASPAPVDIPPPATSVAELVEVETHASTYHAEIPAEIADAADASPTDIVATTPGPTEVPAMQSPAPGLTPGGTRILSGDVQRFMITSGVRANEPLGSISEIAEDPRVPGLLKVYAFADVKNLRGETLRYRWLRDDVIAADIEIEVGSARWRSYTSKYLNAQMRGAWRVELSNSDGQLLASTAFEY